MRSRGCRRWSQVFPTDAVTPRATRVGPRDDLDELIARAEAKLEALRRRALRDPAAFAEYAIRDPDTGAELRNGEHHREWHRLATAHDKLVLFAPVEHGKSIQMAVARVLWTLGHRPNAKIAIISNTAEQAEKLLRVVRQNIESNPLVAEVFPNLRRSDRDEDPWRENMITVARTVLSKDPSVQALGVGGPINGARIDLMILDDVCDFENTRTAEQCQKLVDWFDTTCDTRLRFRSRLIVIGTPWSKLDLLHVLGGRVGYHHARYQAVRNPTAPAEQWIPLWPEVWPWERLVGTPEKPGKYRTTPVLVFSRKWLCEVRSDELARFKSEWIDRCVALGKGRAFTQRRPQLVNGTPLRCFTGVDLGVGNSARAKLKSRQQGGAVTSLFTFALDPRGRRMVLRIESGHWTAPEILSRLSWTYRAFESEIGVEDNGAQDFLLQWAETRAIPITAFTTGANKHHEEYGVEALAVELRSGLWVIPSGASGQDIPDEARAWIGEMLHYTPHAHTGDRLMASWIAREIAREAIFEVMGHLDTTSR